MYIVPDSEVYMLSGVPLSTQQKHTIYFSDKKTQADYFISKAKKHFAKVTYNRVNKGKCRLQATADSLYDCNYMMFQNSAFSTRWFYAFVTGIEYINNVTAEITFQIDVLQTYWFDIERKECFVEREHSVSDKIGEHILPENVECGEYVYNDDAQLIGLGSLSTCTMVLLATTGGYLYDGVYSGYKIKAFANTEAGSKNLTNFLNQYLTTPDNILALYTCPTDILPVKITDDGVNITFTQNTNPINVTGVPISASDTINGYRPRNKKLYTYPFNFNEVRNNCGQTLIQRYEFSDNLTPYYNIVGNMTMPVQEVLRLDRYKATKTRGTGRMDMTETITLDSFPLCSWNVDAFNAWVAQNAVPITINAIPSAVQTATGMITGQSGNSALGSVQNILTSAYTASISANDVKGNYATNNALFGKGQVCFEAQRKSITAEYAKAIDKYFDVFGYACHTTKVPNVSSRPHWNYTKTVDCTIVGGAPSDDIAQIESYFNSGITFWKNPNEVGNYWLDNSV